MMSERRRVVIVHNPCKPDAQATTEEVARAVQQHAEVVATGDLDASCRLCKKHPDRLIVLGGDGSILAASRALGEHQLPIIGINFGKLGYLAEFSLAELHEHLPAILVDDTIVSRRMILDVCIEDNGGSSARALAINDAVVHAGPPYRMIDLGITVDGDELAQVSGDGLVLATPSGSTAHNMSVGGPIMQSETRAIAVTPISPHSLTLRPLVVNGDSCVEVVARRVNEGTTAVIDGQVSLPMKVGDRLVVRRYPHEFQLVRHPAQSRWYTLTRKLKWGQ